MTAGTLPQKNFQSRISKFSAGATSESVCAAARRVLPSGTDALAAVAKASTACAPLYSWALAQLEHTAQLRRAAPLQAEIEVLELELGELRERLAASTAEAAGLRQQLAALEVEVEVVEVEVSGGGACL